ncbi:DNA starvation/stationary phase protection protein [Oceanobacillus halophilus]|uniref:DNA starvation/stationary phase protection protein n=2 Tax=Oceanobacillus halophilus TaxID=930130 RepID=A0A495ADF2_9BACI|nr:DNA starvation/stationary phase protection protein [Oceanobacillus halophilus]
MYVKLHRYHWFVQGRHFFTLHEKFEEMYEMVASDLDEIAERILAIDGKPLATMIKYLKETTLTEANADDKENEIIDQLTKDYKQIIDEIKEEGIPLAEKHEDEPSADLLITIQGKLEKYVWMLNSYRAYDTQE